MKKAFIIAIALIAITSLYFLTSNCFKAAKPVPKTKNISHKKFVPDEHFFNLRTHPSEPFGFAAYQNGIKQAVNGVSKQKAQRSAAGGNWQVEGPTNIGGRINTVAVNPDNDSIIFVGCSRGGVFRSTDKANSWKPVFDDQPFLAIGDIVFDPNNSNTIWVGTGDPNISGYTYIGDGIYKSDDGGDTWTNMGLTNQRIISKIEINPLNSNTIYVGTMGLPFEKNNDRGLYKSMDGGVTWNQVLFVNDSTGIIDLIVDPVDTNVVYTAAWNRIRNNKQSMIAGPDARVHKSTDGGATWTILTGGLPTFDASRITLQMHPTDHDTIFASYVDTTLEIGAIYYSFDAGANWDTLEVTDLKANGALGGFGWYFDHLRINPYNPNEMFVLGVQLWSTTNGGVSWNMVDPPWQSYSVHADKHDLVYYAPGSFYLATDGGLYRSTNNGFSFDDVEDLPNSQFYHVAVNPHVANDYWGGMQDNGTSHGNITNSNNWPRSHGGDGFNVDFHTSDPNIVYAETQNGGIAVSTIAGAAGTFSNATNGIPPAGIDRRSWDMPFIVSVHNPEHTYAGTYRLFKNTGGAGFINYQSISNDLTDGVIYRRGYHVITTIRESNHDANTIFVGTADGNVQRTTNGGSNWTNISLGLPDRYITDIEASHLDSATLYVTSSGYRDNDFTPYLHKSTDNGATWTSISGNLPMLGINDMEVYPCNEDYMFVANDAGIYHTEDGGATWNRTGTNMPIILVFDVELDLVSKRVVAGTFARSLQTFPLDSIIPQSNPIVASAGANDTICLNDTTQLTATTLNATQIQWAPTTGLSCSDCLSPTIIGLTSNTTYTITASDNCGNVASSSVTVVVNPLPMAPTITQTGDTLLVSNPAPTSTYQWYKNNVPILIADTIIIIPDMDTASYTVVVTNSNGCVNSSLSYTYNYFNNIGKALLPSFNFYPNPASSKVFIDLDEDYAAYELEVYSLDGRKVLAFKELPKQMDVSTLVKGEYLMTITQSGKVVRGEKLIIN